jgi:hypothetical protein
LVDLSATVFTRLAAAHSAKLGEYNRHFIGAAMIEEGWMVLGMKEKS